MRTHAGIIAGIPTILLRDTFGGVAGTNLTAHAMDVGGGWTQFGGGPAKLDGAGKAYGSVSGENGVTADAGKADVIYTLDFTYASADTIGLLFLARHSGPNDYWELYTTDNGAHWQLIRVKVGVTATFGYAVSSVLVNGQTYGLKV